MKALDYQRPLVKVLHRVIPVFSNRRVPEIEMSPDQCRGCGLCAKRCPAGAISMKDGVPNIDGHECMHCYHCVSVCKAGALHYDEQRLRDIVAFNKRVLGEEKPATAFI